MKFMVRPFYKKYNATFRFIEKLNPDELFYLLGWPVLNLLKQNIHYYINKKTYRWQD